MTSTRKPSMHTSIPPNPIANRTLAQSYAGKEIPACSTFPNLLTIACLALPPRTRLYFSDLLEDTVPVVEQHKKSVSH